LVRQIDAMLDLSWVYKELAPYYSQTAGLRLIRFSLIDMQAELPKRSRSHYDSLTVLHSVKLKPRPLGSQGFSLNQERVPAFAGWRSYGRTSAQVRRFERIANT
jgi:hypothetical protein